MKVTGGVVNGIRIKFLLQEPAYVLSSNPKAKTLEEGDECTKEQSRNNSLKVMNMVEKEWDQMDTQLAKYGQNS
jgi:hypothetical protein